MSLYERTPFIRQWDQSAAESSRAIAWMLINQARGLDPDRYPSDREWRNHFIKQAMAAWRSYRLYRKESSK
jgi:hypothetical protein